MIEICGGLQGDTLAPYLFDIVIYVLHNATEKRSLGITLHSAKGTTSRITWQDLYLTDLDYVDDIALLSLGNLNTCLTTKKYVLNYVFLKNYVLRKSLKNYVLNYVINYVLLPRSFLNYVLNHVLIHFKNYLLNYVFDFFT